ncbi:MAG: exodeoxyribonuclease VII large subunit [Acidobacteriota bacterium]
MIPGQQRPKTVSEITTALRAALEESFSDLSVVGEISNLKRHASGHVYFSLKDLGAQLRCVLFASDARAVRFAIADGLKVVARGDVSIYPPMGQYQLQVRRLEPVGLGALQAAFEKLKEKLKAEGLFEDGRKRPLPQLPRHIGVVTSPSGAVIRDILRGLERRFPNVQVTLYPARVQGDGAALQIAHGIRTLNRLGKADVIIVARGGGSLEDLWAFNDEDLARTIAASRLPVISAVGHQTDFTIADFVADVRAPTPSAAAEMVVPVKVELVRRIGDLRGRLANAVLQRAAGARARLSRLATHRALERPRSILSLRRQRVDELSGRAASEALRALVASRTRVERLRAKVELLDPRRALASRRRLLRALEERLAFVLRSRFPSRRKALLALGARLSSTASAAIPGRRRELSALRASLQHLSPLAVLERGYAIVRTDPGARVVKDAAQVRAGQRLSVRLHAGELDVRVQKAEARGGDGPAQPSLFAEPETEPR